MRTTPRWVVLFDEPLSTIPGHVIKEADAPHTPVALIPVNAGASPKGRKRQKVNAVLAAHAPELFDLAQELVESHDISTPGIRRRAIDVIKAIRKASL
jgi:predicted metal-dependent phosphoesterase TrpH